MCTEAYQGKAVDLDVKNLHLCVAHITALAFVLLIGFQVRAEPLQLKGPLWVVTIIHLIQAWSKQTNTQTHKLKKTRVSVNALYMHIFM